MVIGFSDIGSAWTGKTPYSTENSFNSKTKINKNPFNIDKRIHFDTGVSRFHVPFDVPAKHTDRMGFSDDNDKE